MYCATARSRILTTVIDVCTLMLVCSAARNLALRFVPARLTCWGFDRYAPFCASLALVRSHNYDWGKNRSTFDPFRWVLHASW